MRPQEIVSSLFVLHHRKHKDARYKVRSVNMVFQDRMSRMFSVISPTIGSIINAGDRMVIDKIEYKNDQIILWVTTYTINDLPQEEDV